MIDRILDIIRDIPIGTVIFLGILLWSFLGRGDKKPGTTTEQRRAQTPPGQATYASDERQPREYSDQFGGADFGRQEDRYDDSNEWGTTKYGFEGSDWESDFDDNRDDEPRIVGRG